MLVAPQLPRLEFRARNSLKSDWSDDFKNNSWSLDLGFSHSDGPCHAQTAPVFRRSLSCEQSFGRAADVCAVIQPALSMQIHDLEARLYGITIIQGLRSGIRLTPKGEGIALRAQETPQ